MIKILPEKIYSDLRESHITWKVALSIVPIAFFTYLFHEFGHWLFGELSGSDMTMSLNSASVKNGQFVSDTSALWSAIGGPFFTILQALIFLFITQKTKSIYFYLALFFGVFSRFFSNIFGGVSLQDEARISTMLQVNEYSIVLIVLLILLLILWRGNRIMALDLKAIGYYTTISTFGILLIIGLNELIS